MEQPPMQDQVIDFINNELLAERGISIGADDDLLLSGHLDSMAIFQLVAFIEGDLGLAVPAQDITVENFKTAATISRYLERL
jgi:acyl carrier protein